VVLVSAPTALPHPIGVKVIQVRTAVEMRDAVVQEAAQAQALIMAAAVADYQPKAAAPGKIKKEGDTLQLELVRTPDTLSSVKGDLVRVGFAAESGDLIENAKKKLREKHLDLIVANDITASDSGFAVDTNRVILVNREGRVENLPLLLKSEVAHRILDRVAEFVTKKA